LYFLNFFNEWWGCCLPPLLGVSLYGEVDHMAMEQMGRELAVVRLMLKV
jgi:hypothetical protein